MKCGIDPGGVNAALTIRPDTKGRLYSGLLPASDHWILGAGSMADPVLLLQFQTQWRNWLNIEQPCLIRAERFLSRGLRGDLGERVSYMLGVIATVCHETHTHLHLIHSAHWKGAFARQYGKESLEHLYNVASERPVHPNPKKRARRKWLGWTPHEVDSMLLTLAEPDAKGKLIYSDQAELDIKQWLNTHPVVWST